MDRAEAAAGAAGALTADQAEALPQTAIWPGAASSTTSTTSRLATIVRHPLPWLAVADRRAR